MIPSQHPAASRGQSVYCYNLQPPRLIVHRMYGWRQLLAVLTLLTHTVFAARTIPKNEQCVTAVYTALNYVSFVGEPLVGMWPMRCQNYLEVTSIYVAAEIYCTDDERVAGFAQLDTECLKNAYVNFLSRQNVAENLTDEKIQHMKIVEFDELPEDSIDYPVLVSLDFYDRTFHTIVGSLDAFTSRKKKEKTKLMVFSEYMAD